MIKYFGWKCDSPDARDHKYLKRTPLTSLRSINLQDKYKMPPVYDQLALGSCTANAIGYTVNYSVLNNFIQDKSIKCNIPVSRLFIYYNERAIEDTVAYDSGAMIRDGIKSLAKQGVCSEETWPYNINRFTRKPYPSAYAEALNFTAVSYERIDNTNKLEIVDCLASGHPVIIGATLYDSFESEEVAQTGEVPMPDFSTESVLGGHAFLIYRWRMSTDRFYCVNSWGSDWGMQGRFSIPASYLTNTDLADDAWTLKVIK